MILSQHLITGPVIVRQAVEMLLRHASFLYREASSRLRSLAVMVLDAPVWRSNNNIFRKVMKSFDNDRNVNAFSYRRTSKE